MEENRKIAIRSLLLALLLFDGSALCAFSVEPLPIPPSIFWHSIITGIALGVACCAIINLSWNPRTLSSQNPGKPGGCLYVVISTLVSIVCGVSLLMRFKEYENVVEDTGFLMLFILLNVILLYAVAASWYFRPKSDTITKNK